MWQPLYTGCPSVHTHWTFWWKANFCFYQSQFHLCLSFKNSILWSRICSCSRKADSPTGESIIVTISCSVTTEIQYISKIIIIIMIFSKGDRNLILVKAKCFANVRKYFITFMCYCYEDCCYLILNDSRRGKELSIITNYLCSISASESRIWIKWTEGQSSMFHQNLLRFKEKLKIYD